MRKGISTVIAALLMLIITIALAGFAYTYISGVLTSKTAVSLDIQETTCVGEFIQVTVRNGGTSPSGDLTLTATDPDGGATGTCTITSLNAGTSGSCPTSGLNRAATSEAGTYRIRITGGSASPASGTVFCTGAGTTA